MLSEVPRTFIESPPSMPLLTDELKILRIKTTKVTQLYPDLHANNRPVSKFALSKQKAIQTQV